MQSINRRQRQAQEDSPLMVVFPRIRPLKGSTALRASLIALTFFLPALLPAQQVTVTLPSGKTTVNGISTLYNGQYAIRQTTFGFLWLDTVALTGGHVQAISVCVAGLPPSDSPYNLAGGD